MFDFFIYEMADIYTLPVNVEVKQNPTGNPKIAPANRFRKTEPGMANVCLKR